MSRVCPICDSKNSDDDPIRGSVSCMECGYMIEECQVVSEIQFHQSNTGEFQLVGQFVGLQVSHGRQRRNRPITEQKYTPREVFIYKGGQTMKMLGKKMHIGSDIINSAIELFKTCVNQNLARTLDNDHILVICMFVICRLMGAPHDLSEFAKRIKASMQELQRSHDFLMRYLSIDLPAGEN